MISQYTATGVDSLAVHSQSVFNCCMRTIVCDLNKADTFYIPRDRSETSRMTSAAGFSENSKALSKAI